MPDRASRARTDAPRLDERAEGDRLAGRVRVVAGPGTVASFYAAVAAAGGEMDRNTGLAAVRAAASLSRTDDAGIAAAEAADAAAVALGGTCDLAVFFATAEHADSMAAIAAAIESRLEPSASIGAVAQGVIGPGEEVEAGPAVSVWAADLGPGQIQAFRSWVIRTSDGGMAVVGWPDSRPGDLTVVLADPFSFPAAEVASRLGEQRPGQPLSGGLVTGGPGQTRLVIDGRVHEDGAVGVVLGGVPSTAVVSQGCRPVGEPLTVTAADRNRVLELGGRPAAVRLQELLEASDEAERALLRFGGVHLGLVVDELRDTYDTGDFLVRGVLGVDTDEGALTIGDFVRVGQVVQFHARDASSAAEDLQQRLHGLEVAVGALLFTCNGRGQGLFGVPDHDVRAVEAALGCTVAGAFCAGELGPVGERSYLHGFTASLAVLPAAEDPG